MNMEVKIAELQKIVKDLRGSHDPNDQQSRIEKDKLADSMEELVKYLNSTIVAVKYLTDMKGKLEGQKDTAAHNGSFEGERVAGASLLVCNTLLGLLVTDN